MARAKKLTREQKFEQNRCYPASDHTECNGYWSPDCQGKGDFDGAHVRFDTRCWPDMTAKCSLYLMSKDAGEADGLLEDWVDGKHGEPYLQGKYEIIIENDGYLNADSFDELRCKVEQWHEIQRMRVVKAIKAEFGK